MTTAGRRLVADWLREHAAELELEGDNYSSRFTARYFAR